MQSDFVKVLDERLAEAQIKSPSYSLRAFAKKLGVSVSTVSEIRSGRRRLTPELFDRMADGLFLKPEERARFSALASDDRARVQIEHDQFEMISEWYHFAILSLVRLKDFRSDNAWIAKRLGISQAVAKSAVERLIRLELLRKNKGKFERTKNEVRTSDGIASLAVRKAHTENLELARRALEELPVDERDFVFYTLPASPSKLAEARRRIRKSLDELNDFLESSPHEEVYRMCFQLFPLSKGEKK